MIEGNGGHKVDSKERGRGEESNLGRGLRQRQQREEGRRGWTMSPSCATVITRTSRRPFRWRRRRRTHVAGARRGRAGRSTGRPHKTGKECTENLFQLIIDQIFFCQNFLLCFLSKKGHVTSWTSIIR